MATAFQGRRTFPAAAAAVLAVCAILAPRAAGAYEFNRTIEVFVYVSAWVTVYEQMEEASGLVQYPSGNEAAASASGFSLSRLRVGLRLTLLKGWLQLKAQVKLERDPAVMDIFLQLNIRPWIRFKLGQFIVPGAYENMIDNRSLDFIQRTHLARNLVDWSLSRTPHVSSLFHGNRSYRRDFGLAMAGDIDIRRGFIRTIIMVGNGLGNNLYIGGSTNKEFIVTNLPQFFYGIRLELADLFDVLTVGGHFTYNEHDNIVLNSGRTVYDLNRISGSGDVRVKIPRTGLRAAGMFGYGEVREDFDRDGHGDLTYYGWEAKILWSLTGLAAGRTDCGFCEKNSIELGGRYENYTTEFNGSGVRVEQNDWTIGLNYEYIQYLKVQVNYVLRRTTDPSFPDLDDDILFVNVQFSI